MTQRPSCTVKLPVRRMPMLVMFQAPFCARQPWRTRRCAPQHASVDGSRSTRIVYWIQGKSTLLIGRRRSHDRPCRRYSSSSQLHRMLESLDGYSLLGGDTRFQPIRSRWHAPTLNTNTRTWTTGTDGHRNAPSQSTFALRLVRVTAAGPAMKPYTRTTVYSPLTSCACSFINASVFNLQALYNDVDNRCSWTREPKLHSRTKMLFNLLFTCFSVRLQQLKYMKWAILLILHFPQSPLNFIGHKTSDRA
jgi:hypothetical protein